MGNFNTFSATEPKYKTQLHVGKADQSTTGIHSFVIYLRWLAFTAISYESIRRWTSINRPKNQISEQVHASSIMLCIGFWCIENSAYFNGFMSNTERNVITREIVQGSMSPQMSPPFWKDF